MNLESLTDEELTALQEEFTRLGTKHTDTHDEEIQLLEDEKSLRES